MPSAASLSTVRLLPYSKPIQGGPAFIYPALHSDASKRSQMYSKKTILKLLDLHHTTLRGFKSDNNEDLVEKQMAHYVFPLENYIWFAKKMIDNDIMPHKSLLDNTNSTYEKKTVVRSFKYVYAEQEDDPDMGLTKHIINHFLDNKKSLIYHLSQIDQSYGINNNKTFIVSCVTTIQLRV